MAGLASLAPVAVVMLVAALLFWALAWALTVLMVMRLFPAGQGEQGLGGRWRNVGGGGVSEGRLSCWCAQRPMPTWEAWARLGVTAAAICFGVWGVWILVFAPDPLQAWPLG